MKCILELNHDKSIYLFYYKGGFIKKSYFTAITELPFEQLKNKEIILLIPDSFLITKTLNISFDIKNMLALKSYLIKSLPVNLSDIYNDYVVFGNKLYFIGLKKEAINDVLSVIKKARGKLKTVLPKSYIFKIAYNLNSPKFMGFNFNSFYTSIFAYEGNGYFFFVVLPYGSNSDLTEDLSITKFINELYRIVSSFQTQTKIAIEEFFFFADKEYKDLPVLSYLSKTFQGIKFVTMDEGKYLDVYSKILDYSGKFPINLALDKISWESNKESLLVSIDNSVNIFIILLIVMGILVYIFSENRLKKEEMILQAMKNNYQATLNQIKSEVNLRKNVVPFSLPVWQIFCTLNEYLSTEQIYIENFYVKDNEVNFFFISQTYTAVYFLNNRLKELNINSNIESNSKFTVEQYLEFNRSKIRILPKK